MIYVVNHKAMGYSNDLKRNPYSKDVETILILKLVIQIFHLKSWIISSQMPKFVFCFSNMPEKKKQPANFTVWDY